jgi:hypothetical protein
VGSQLLSQQEPDFVYQVIQAIPHLYMGYCSLTKWDALQKFIMGLLLFPRYLPFSLLSSEISTKKSMLKVLGLVLGHVGVSWYHGLNYFKRFI